MALLSGLLAVAALGLAADPPTLAVVHPMAVRAAFGSLAMAALAAAGALLRPLPIQASLQASLGLGSGSLGGFRTASLALGTIGLSHLLNSLLVLLDLRRDSVLTEIDQMVASATGPEHALLFVGLAVAPAIGEELLFRGLILRSAAANWGPAVGLLSSSCLFGLAHLDWAQGGAAMLLGLYLGAIALKSGGIRACIVCHMANNAAALALADSEFANLGFALALSATAAAAGLVALVTMQRSQPAAKLQRAGHSQADGNPPAQPREDGSRDPE